MLQQTQAARVVAPYRRFLRLFPTLRALACASRAEVLEAWDGLGYNRRAVALSEAARVVEVRHGGRIPRDVEELIALPGVGPYTAAAVASIAFGRRVASIDTNVRRIVSRVFLGARQGSAAEVRRLANEWLDPADPAGWNQALMDLGREVCRPRPACRRCPLASVCRFALDGSQGPRTTARIQGRFEGSSRQARGAVVRALRREHVLSLATLAERTGLERKRLVLAVRALADEGLVAAGPAARAGRPRGRVRLGV
jgi:A/G-specific adenine glycosylase